MIKNNHCDIIPEPKIKKKKGNERHFNNCICIGVYFYHLIDIFISIMNCNMFHSYMKALNSYFTKKTHFSLVKLLFL